ELSRLRLPTLIVAGAAVGVGTLADHLVPEVVGDSSVISIAGEFIDACRSDHLRNMRINVQALQLIAMAGERIEKSTLVEAPRTCQVLAIAGHGIQIREHLAHSAVLGVEHALHVLIGESA